ncbi:MAG: hypothetical protein ACLR23_26250 [Clostridia bacterium]
MNHFECPMMIAYNKKAMMRHESMMAIHRAETGIWKGQADLMGDDDGFRNWAEEFWILPIAWITNPISWRKLRRQGKSVSALKSLIETIEVSANPWRAFASEIRHRKPAALIPCYQEDVALAVVKVTPARCEAATERFPL